MQKWGVTLVMIVLGCYMIYPFIWMISTSFKTPLEVFAYPVEWLPQKPILEHHLKVWTGSNSFWRYYFNSIKISLIDAIGATFLAAMAAYGFSKIEFKGRNVLFFLYLSMMMVPPQVLFVPRFLMFDRLGIYNTHWALILPGLFTIFGVFMLRQFFASIPKDIIESGMIDGAGHASIFLRLVLPVSKPALATLAVLDFSWHWNDYENALVFLIDKSKYTVPLAMQNFILENTIDYNGMMAAATAGVLPMLIVFLIGQKFIIRGMMSSAVKG
ncbi:carbohydrate ABC transporter permease [Paenibacillus sp. HWE-109]|nr:carbohydrate ABC transporter permease [Paenibacillus sp. HWE-109]UKS31051.1 carbohydrate ABC transporter permease [Paenibacillus sp. HWE-109]